ncbi:MAG: T9SS type A sorting domain-containing protein [Chitinophagaceae bacterium]|nr:T9SS type A sorting domain-containing protein [Chitinophagaceae bacterium]
MTPTAQNNLLTAYPNPFSGFSTISFSLSQPGNLSLKIYDVTGRLVRVLLQANLTAGTHELTWDARDENGNGVSAGIYFLELRSTDFSRTEKLMVTK